ncbi:MAG: superoxide dismutase [Alphaproteobacteria bacterium]|nr:superoxide dismutase [Alphaproteobacteria bacterium]
MPVKQPPLPYAYEALAPHVSAETMHVHYDKHHATYVQKTNELIRGTPFEKLTLEEIVRRSAGDPQHRKIFNNAAQAWNHNVFWESMSPRGGDGARHRELVAAIDRSFGGHAEFAARFAKAAVEQFGSGWAWLVADDDGRLEIVTTGNAGNPMADGRAVLLTCDVWEHAYYLDYRNRRDAFVKVFLDKLVNWERAAEALAQHVGADAPARRAASR